MKLVKITIQTLVFFLLTLITQVGGIIYLISFIITKQLKYGIGKTSLIFIGLYLVISLLIMPIVAPIFGRAALPLSGNLQPLNIMTCLFNRHYVRLELKENLIEASNKMSEEFKGTKTNYLDASFPFINGFPLIPHLSHNDGKKVDLAFYYNDKASQRNTNEVPSFIGYGIYDSPKENEENYPEQCNNKGYWQYGFLTYLVPKWNEENYTVDSERTSKLIRLLAINNSTSKVFIEPHLKQRWGLASEDKIRFHGCQAVRHDDHIHLQIK